MKELIAGDVFRTLPNIDAVFWYHSFSTYAKFSEKNNISYPLIRTRTCACQGVRKVSFSGNFAYVLND